MSASESPRTEAPVAAPAVFRVDGMTCQNCARHAREAAEGVEGVAGASVDLDAGRVKVRWSPAVALPAAEVAVARALQQAGYPATVIAPELLAAGAARPGSGWRFNVALGGPATLFLMLAEWVFGWAHEPWFGWVALGVALPVQVLCGARFYRGAWQQLKRGASNMDTLVALGSSAAFAFSVWVLFSRRGGHVYFMESTAIISLISIGHWLEALVSARAAGAIRSLMNLAPAEARRIDPDGTERVVPVAELIPGDRIALRPGDRIPTDAEVIEGASAVDEAVLTGEAKPVEKGPGKPLYAGTTNTDGRLRARVTVTGEGTALAHIIAAVERAQNSRASIQRVGDQVSSVFVPVVLLLAVLTGAFWGWAPETARALHDALAPWLWTLPLPDDPFAAAILHATAVLIIACPCAMGLATPAAIMAGTNAAALRGVLIRDGVALEKAGRIRSVVFDKTGTLTQGRLAAVAVRDLRVENGRSGRIEVLAAQLAKDSAHPVARALAALAPAAAMDFAPLPGLPTLGTRNAGTPSGPIGLRTDLRFRPAGAGPQPTVRRGWTDWRELRGRGIEARHPDGVLYRLGSLVWLHESGVRDASAERGGAAARGATVTLVGLSADDQLLGLFELRDALRPESHDLVAALHRDGFDVFLLTGDAWLAAEAVAHEVGIPSTHVLADVKPEQKSQAIARLQASGHRVAFVGDGLNDGPALAQADLGIAVSRATDVARESADVVLMWGDLRAIREAIGLAQATLRTIHQNLFWAFFYNAAAVPLAMLGFFSPVVCAVAMGLSDLLLIGNTLRLRYWTLRGRLVHPAREPAAGAGVGVDVETGLQPRGQS